MDPIEASLFLEFPADPLYAEYLGCYSVPEASLDHSSGRDWYVNLCFSLHFHVSVLMLNSLLIFCEPRKGCYVTDLCDCFRNA